MTVFSTAESSGLGIISLIRRRCNRIDANAQNKWNKQCAQGFKLIGKKADQWTNTWIELLEIEYEDEATFKELIEFFN